MHDGEEDGGDEEAAEPEGELVGREILAAGVGLQLPRLGSGFLPHQLAEPVQAPA